MATVNQAPHIAHRGSCHCGQVRFTFETAKAPDEWTVRSCTCSFCRRHRPIYVADPEGRVSLEHGEQVSSYRFGTGSAAFLCCGRCGVFVAVVDETPRRRVGLVNVNCLEHVPAGVPEPRLVDFDGESLDERRERRSRSWTPFTS